MGKEEENKLKKMCTNIIIFHCFVSFIKLSPLSRERDVVGEKNDIRSNRENMNIKDVLILHHEYATLPVYWYLCVRYSSNRH